MNESESNWSQPARASNLVDSNNRRLCKLLQQVATRRRRRRPLCHANVRRSRFARRAHWARPRDSARRVARANRARRRPARRAPPPPPPQRTYDDELELVTHCARRVADDFLAASASNHQLLRLLPSVHQRVHVSGRSKQMRRRLSFVDSKAGGRRLMAARSNGLTSCSFNSVPSSQQRGEIASGSIVEPCSSC